MNEIRPPLGVRPLLGLLLALVTLTACAEPTTAPTAISPSALSARELSLAMQDASARAALFEALRASPYSEHKVSLQGLLLAPTGGPIVVALAKGRGVREGAVRAGLQGSAALDVYMPKLDHRVSWTGKVQPVVVDAREYGDGRVTVWKSGVEFASLDPRLGSTAEPLLLIQSSEPRAYRIGLYREVRGGTLQAQGEVQEGAVLFHRTGETIDSIQVAELFRAGSGGIPRWAKACPPEQQDLCEPSGGGGGGTGQNDPVWQTLGSTYLTQITTEGICDNNFCGLGDSNEFEFTAEWRYGNVTESNTIRRTDVPTTGSVNDLHLLLLNRKTTLAAPISVSLVETDSFGDDEFGTIYLEEGHQNLNNIWFPNYPSITPYVAARFTW